MDRGCELKLNLGCGFDKREGWLNVDNFPECEPDQLLDLEATPWDLPSEAFDHILLKHVLEHVGGVLAERGRGRPMPPVVVDAERRTRGRDRAEQRVLFVAPEPGAVQVRVVAEISDGVHRRDGDPAALTLDEQVELRAGPSELLGALVDEVGHLPAHAEVDEDLVEDSDDARRLGDPLGHRPPVRRL